jgi:hypothetical protein
MLERVDVVTPIGVGEVRSYVRGEYYAKNIQNVEINLKILKLCYKENEFSGILLRPKRYVDR